MTRKLCATTLALALVGGVYLAAQPAAASNMGFKLERDFEVIDGFRGLYYVSFPLFNGLGDVATSTVLAGNMSPCVGDVGGPAMGDGIVDGVDAACDLWTSRLGTFNISRYNHAACAFETLTLNSSLFGIAVSSETLAPLPTDEAFQVNVPAELTSIGAQNQAVIVGSHDPSYAGRTLQDNAACGLDIALINVPYHTMYQRSGEILCGLEGVDWILGVPGGRAGPIDPAGDPTSNAEPAVCPNGIFDGTTLVNVLTFDNENDGLGADNQFIVSSVEDTGIFGLAFVNFPGYDLVPGDGYLVRMTPGHGPSTFLSPHF